MKIRSVGDELLHTDGQTYMTKLLVACRNFANAPNKYYCCYYYGVHYLPCKPDSYSPGQNIFTRRLILLFIKWYRLELCRWLKPRCVSRKPILMRSSYLHLDIPLTNPSKFLVSNFIFSTYVYTTSFGLTLL